MNKNLRNMGLLLALNFEALTLVVAGMWIAGWLDEKYPKDFSWLVVTVPVALGVIVHNGIFVLRKVISGDKENPKSGD